MNKFVFFSLPFLSVCIFKGITTYYSKNITTSDIELVQDFMKLNVSIREYLQQQQQTDISLYHSHFRIWKHTIPVCSSWRRMIRCAMSSDWRLP